MASGKYLTDYYLPEKRKTKVCQPDRHSLVLQFNKNCSAENHNLNAEQELRPLPFALMHGSKQT
jgi:hypothetical protein